MLLFLVLFFFCLFYIHVCVTYFDPSGIDSPDQKLAGENDIDDDEDYSYHYVGDDKETTTQKDDNVLENVEKAAQADEPSYDAKPETVNIQLDNIKSTEKDEKNSTEKDEQITGSNDDKENNDVNTDDSDNDVNMDDGNDDDDNDYKMKDDDDYEDEDGYEEDDDYEEDEDGDDSEPPTPQGNPPVLSNTDLANLRKEAENMTDEEREKLREQVASSFGLSPFDVVKPAVSPLGVSVDDDVDDGSDVDDYEEEEETTTQPTNAEKLANPWEDEKKTKDVDSSPMAGALNNLLTTTAPAAGNDYQEDDDDDDDGDKVDAETESETVSQETHLNIEPLDSVKSDDSAEENTDVNDDDKDTDDYKNYDNEEDDEDKDYVDGKVLSDPYADTEPLRDTNADQDSEATDGQYAMLSD